MSISIKCGMKQSPRVRMLELMLLLSVIFWQALTVQGGKQMDSTTLSTRELDKTKTFTRPADLTLWGARQRDVSSKKILIYEEAFVVAYNRLAKRSVSKGGRKSLALAVTNVKFVPGSIFPSDFSTSEITLSFDVTFTCKVCDSNTTLFRYDAPTRKLNGLDSQDVSLHPEIHDVRHLSAGLFTAESFTIAYNNELKSLAKKGNSLIPALKWSDINEGCTDENIFESSIVLQLLLVEQETIAPEQLDSLAQGVVESYNSLNVPKASVCDPFFHLIVAAVAEVIETDGGSIPSNQNRRNLATRLSVKVNVSFKCKACSSGSRLLRNDASRRRRQLKPSRDLVVGKSQERFLVTSANSCTCPVGSVADVPTYSALADKLDEYIATKITDLDAEVDKVDEVVTESCPGTMITRKNILRFNANGCSTRGDLLADAVKTSMNDLLSKFCDTEFRTVASVVFDGVIVDLSIFAVFYTCRDCALGTSLLDPGIPFTTRALSLETRGDGNQLRRLPEFNNVCFCNVDADNTRIPTTDEFAIAMFDTVGCTLTSIVEEVDR
ncbi:hypothetical protein MHU86_8998 [Fragilaria crotonensis]|nr:hypothetical protein MHU86_8998 [Fragilaria crotonensis]